MHPSSLRRLIAACASALLTAGLLAVASSPAHALSDDVMGTVHGTVTDLDGNPLSDVEVSGYPTDGEYGDLEPKNYDPQVQTTTNQAGEYTLDTKGLPLILYISQDSGGYVGEYYDNTADWHAAEVVSASDEESLLLNPVNLTPELIKNQTPPRISGNLYVGGTVRASEGGWSANGLTFKYQWYRLVGASPKKLTGANKSTYKLNSHDYNHKLKVLVTASQTGTPSVIARSSLTKAAKRGSKVSLSASSSSKGTVKLSFKVTVRGISRASGKVKVSCFNSLITYKSKTVKLKKGKGTATLKPVPKGTRTCKASYYSSTHIAGSSKTRTVKVK